MDRSEPRRPDDPREIPNETDATGDGRRLRLRFSATGPGFESPYRGNRPASPTGPNNPFGVGDLLCSRDPLGFHEGLQAMVSHSVNGQSTDPHSPCPLIDLGAHHQISAITFVVGECHARSWRDVPREVDPAKLFEGRGGGW
jgi:hypothetical protein